MSRKYEYNGKIEEMKTLPSEISIKEFQSIVKDQNKYEGDFLYYLETFEKLGLSREFTDDIDDNTLFILLKDFQDDFVVSGELINEIKIDNYTYRSYDEGTEFVLKARDFANIEEKIRTDENWMTYLISILFKRTDLSNVEHKDPNHIKHKQKLFENVTVDIALPYIIKVTDSYISNIKIMNDI